MAENEEDLFEQSQEPEKVIVSDEVKKKRKDWVSAWMKSLRLGRLEDSMYWLNIMACVGELSEYYIGLRMAAFAGEDCWDVQAIILTSALETMIDRHVPDIWNHIYFVNWYLCTCPKFWSNEAGVEVQRTLMTVQKRFKDDGKGGIEPEEIPSWSQDLHTTAGREAAGAGEWGKVDRRFGGDEVGIITRILMYKRLGKLSPDGGMDDFWKAMAVVKAQKAVTEGEQE
jgi:replication-associated recombination protein RarA